MKKNFKYGLLLLTLCLQIPAYAYNGEKINALAQRFMQQNQVPGMSIAVIDQNKIHFYNLGWADPLKKIPTCNQTLYTVGSFTKTFTATLAARAMVEKKIKFKGGPLQMHSTYLQVPAVKEKYLAVGHDSKNNIVAYNKNLEPWFAAASLKSSISDLANYLCAQINPEILADKNLSKAISWVHQNKACFADKLSCEQLAWQAHRLSVIKNSMGDTYFIAFDKEGFPEFYNKKISINKSLDKPIFIDKTGSGYGMSSYMAYIPAQKIGVVILTNKFLGDERIKLGRDILQNL